MSRLRFTYLFLFLASLAFESSAQNEAITEPQLFYRKQSQFGFNLNSAGLGGINFRQGWHKTGRIKDLLDIEFCRVRDPKETRIYGASDNPQQYTYGRLNMAFFLRTGYGRTINLTERPYKNAIGLNFNYAVGVTTALLKPIYLDILYIYSDKVGAYVKPERYDPNNEKHRDQNSIYGNSSFFEGITETVARFGGFGKASLSVEWGQFPDEFHTLEAGCTLDYFPAPLPLMANLPRRDIFFILFIGYSFGFNK